MRTRPDDGMEGNLVLTPSALFAFLTQIEELDGKEITFSEEDGSITVQIGSNVYSLESPEGSEIELSEDTIDEFKEINEEGYDDVESDFDSVEGGILKELTKTLLVGGLVRLTKGAIQNM